MERHLLAFVFLAPWFNAFAQVADTDCVAIPNAGEFIRLDHATRPIQREVFRGRPVPDARNAPPAGTVVRVYSTPMELTGDFDGDGSSETVRAFTEVAGPGGANPCPNGPNGDGCLDGERIVQHPFWSSTGEWTLPAEFPTARSEERISAHVPRSFEIRFTTSEAGSYAWHPFSNAPVPNRMTRYPIEIWDIGDVPPGASNDPSDDVQMALVAFSDNGGDCKFGYGEVELESDVWVSDRLYAYYFHHGVTYDDFDNWLRNVGIPLALELNKPLTGERRSCDAGKSGPFACSGVDLLSYLPVGLMGTGRITDLWGWQDPITGREYALVAATDQFPIIDVTDPVNPFLVGHVLADAQDIKVYADHLFAAVDANPPVSIFDLTRLRSESGPPQVLDADATYEASAHNLAINEETGFLYLGGARTACPGLHMVDIREPLNPTFVGCFVPQEMIGRNGQGYVHDAQCVVYDGPDADYAGREICFTSSETHITIVDVEDKTAPSLVSFATYPNAEYVHQGWLTEDHRYFIQGDELDGVHGVGTRTYIWDVRNLDDPQLLSIYEGTTQATDHNLYVKGQYAYQANYSSGLRVLDISNIESPREVAFFDTYPFDDNGGFRGAWTAYPFLDSGNILVSSQTEGLFVLSLQSGVAVEGDNGLPNVFALSQNYPNPFNLVTTISYALPKAADVTLTVVDLLGRELVESVSGSQPAGPYEITFDASGLPSGIYLYRVQAGDYVETKRMVVVK